LRIVRHDADLLRETIQLRAAATRLAQQTYKPSELDSLLHTYSGPAILVVWVASDSSLVRQQLARYYHELRGIQPQVDGYYLKSLGLKPGPVYGRILNAVRAACLDGAVETRAEEEALVARLLAEMEPGK